MPSTTTSSSSAPARAAARSRTASRRPASASCCSSAAATCRASPRTGTPRRSSARDRYVTERAAGIDKHGAALPPARAVLRRRQHEGLRRDPVPPARARLRRGPPLRRRLAGLADLATPTSSRTTPRPSGSYLVHGAARRGPDRAAALGAVPVSGRHARAADPAAARRPRAHRPPPVPPAGRRRPRRGRPGGGPLRALRPLRRLPVPDRRQGRRARAAACGRR